MFYFALSSSFLLWGKVKELLQLRPIRHEAYVFICHFQLITYGHFSMQITASWLCAVRQSLPPYLHAECLVGLASMTDVLMYEKLLAPKKFCIKVPALLTKLHSAIQSGFLSTCAIVFTRHFFSVTFQHRKSSIIVARQPFFELCQIHHGTGALY